MSFTKIDNKFLEGIYRCDLTASQLRVILVILRYTLGYLRKECSVSYSHIEEKTGLSRSAVRAAVKSLIDMGMITELTPPKNRQSRSIALNVDFFGNNNSCLECLHCDTHRVSESNHSEWLGENTQECLNGDTLECFKSNTNKENIINKKTNKKRERNTPAQSNEKKSRGVFNNVMLTDLEYKELESRYGGFCKKLIDSFSAKLKAKGYEYKDHFAAITLWQMENEKKEEMQKAEEESKGFDTDEFFKIALESSYARLKEGKGLNST